MLTVMAGMAFGWNRTVPGRCGVFLLLTFALGGLASAMNRGGWMILLWAAGLLGLCAWLPVAGGNRYLPVRIQNGDRAIEVEALRDTGNLLRDPITGSSVLILGPAEAEKLTGLTNQQLKDPMTTLTLAPMAGLRLIPCRTVGGCGLLLGRRFGDIRIGGKRGSGLVAFAPEPLGNGIQALTGGSFR